jgi:hypothetical protein
MIVSANVFAPWPKLVMMSEEPDALAVGNAAYAILLRMP